MSDARLPRVIVHNAVSADGRIDHFPADVGLFYELATTWSEDATIAGSGTIIAASEPSADDGAPIPPPTEGDRRPLLVVIDSRGSVRSWSSLLAAGYWRAGVSMASDATPAAHLDWLRRRGIDVLQTSGERVDLRAGLAELARRYGVKTVRLDSGGKLNGAFLRLGLVSEVSLLLHPFLVGGTSPASMFRAPDLAGDAEGIRLELVSCRSLRGGTVWLRYAVRPRSVSS